MTIASGVGSWPGSDAEEYAEAVRVVLGEVPDLPYLPELPGRGAAASMVGRTLATISDLGFDQQPAGWRLTDTSGVDHRRAISRFRRPHRRRARRDRADPAQLCPDHSDGRLHGQGGEQAALRLSLALDFFRHNPDMQGVTPTN